MSFSIPQVLLIGNGLNQAYGGCSWSALLNDLSTRHDIDATKLVCPEPLKAITVTGDAVDIALKGKHNQLFGSIQTDKQMHVLHHVLGLGFDHILTTNYSYELESAALSKSAISEMTVRKLMNHTPACKRAEGKFLLRTYNEATYQNVSNRIWHIHGEARKTNSMILGHYYYGNLLYKIKDYCANRGNAYQKAQKTGRNVDMNSWIDAFLLGDVYVLGFGFGFSEIDLWWLLNRKKREKATTGKVYFYQAQHSSFDTKTDLLKLLGAEIVTCGFHYRTDAHGKEHLDYADFYCAALGDIQAKLNRHRNSVEQSV